MCEIDPGSLDQLSGHIAHTLPDELLRTVGRAGIDNHPMIDKSPDGIQTPFFMIRHSFRTIMFRHTVGFNCSILLLERLIPAMKDRLTYWDTATALYPLREEGNEEYASASRNLHACGFPSSAGDPSFMSQCNLAQSR